MKQIIGDCFYLGIFVSKGGRAYDIKLIMNQNNNFV